MNSACLVYAKSEGDKRAENQIGKIRDLLNEAFGCAEELMMDMNVEKIDLSFRETMDVFQNELLETSCILEQLLKELKQN